MRKSRQSIAYDYVCLSPDEQIPLHRQASWELTYIAVGSGVRLIGGVSESFTRGEVILIPPGMPHCWNFSEEDTDEGGKIVNITLKFRAPLLTACGRTFPELAPAAGELRRMAQGRAVKYGEPASGEIAAALRGMREADDVERLAAFLGLLPTLAQGAAGAVAVGGGPAANTQRERMDSVRVFVECNVSRGIRLDDVARHVGMNRSSFCVFFKQATGTTFVSWLTRYRVSMACRLLRQDGERLHVAEVCYRAGFRDIPHFNRTFRKLMGCTPSKYRAAARATLERRGDAEAD